MKARMKDNLITRYQLCPELNYRGRCFDGAGQNELQCVKKSCGWRDYFELKQFLKSIESKVVDLVFTAGDAFEKQDNNVWLPPSLWEPLG